MSPHVYVRTLKATERKSLAQFIRHGRDASVVRRAQMVQLSSEGKSAGEIAALWQITGQGVRKIIHRFNQESLAGLPDRPRSGRPLKRTDPYVTLLKEAVDVNPRDLGYPFSCWTLRRLREHLALKTQIILSPAHLSNVLAENGIVYRRPKHGMAHLRDPQEYDEKKAFLAFLKKRQPGRQEDSICSTSMSVKFTSIQP